MADYPDRFHLIGILGVFIALIGTDARACGIDWREPKSHFDGVDYQGNVMLVEQLGEVDAGKDLKLPLWAVFGSNSGNNSPYAGRGWTIPLLEAKIVQVNENVFKIDQPNGWFRKMWRSKGDPNVLEGQGGWKAEIQGDNITAWADCGSKLIFSKGRLTQMRLKERKFDFVYEGNRVVEIKEGSAAILKVEQDTIRREVTGFRLPSNRRIGIERTERPKVHVVNSQNLVTGMDQSLSMITRTDGDIRKIGYSVDEKLNPTLKIDDRLIAWNASDNKIKSDGIWRYKIDPGLDVFDNAAIERFDVSGKKESWFIHANQESTESIDGVVTVRSWFGSGLLAGKERSILRQKSGRVVQGIFYSYNEGGNLIRVSRPQEQTEVTYKYEGEKVFTEETHAGRVVLREERNRSTGDSYSWIAPDIEIFSSKVLEGSSTEIKILKGKQEVSRYHVKLD